MANVVKAVVPQIPKEKIEATEPKNVLAKMMVKAPADSLSEIVGQLLESYDNGQDIIMTLMLEKP